MKRKIHLYSLLYDMALLLYFRPANYVIGSGLYSLLSYLIVFLFLFVFFHWVISVINRKTHAPLAILLLIISYGWFLCGSTVLNLFGGRSVDLKAGILWFASIGGFILLCELGLSFRPKIFLSSFVRVGSIVCFLNAITIFLFGKTGGMRRQEVVYGRKLSLNYFLLAEDNATLFYTFPVLVVVWIYYFRFNKTRKMQIWAVTYTAATVFSYVYMNSVSAIITTVLTACLTFLLYRSLKKNKNGKTLLGTITFNRAILVGYISSILLVFTDFISLFRNIIVDWFNKDLTLSSRVFIWQRSIAHMQKAWWIGYGNENPEITTAMIGINHTHNLILEILYRGGVLGILLFTVTLLYCGRKSLRSKGKILYIFLCGALMIFFLSLSVEFGFYRYTYAILIVFALHTELHDSNFDNMYPMVKSK